MSLLLRWLISAISLMLVTYLVPGIKVQGFYSALIAALILGLINSLIKPILILLTLPVNILTLGLFILVINALLFWLAATMVKGFGVAGFWPAFWGALAMSVVSWILNSIFNN
jgi:putative membrane protein